VEIILYCADCDKFFYLEPEGEQISPACTHCGGETTVSCKTTKEEYTGLSNERKEQWKANIRRMFPTKEAVINHNNRIIAQKQHENRLGILFTLQGNRGRSLTMCKTKCIVKTDVTLGSVMTGNATDGEKIIFFKHCSGLQFKESGLTIGYLQFETPSMQMNNMASNYFSENTFTYEDNCNGLTNAIMREVFYFAMELIENCASSSDPEIPEFPALLAEYLKTKR
jgi:hypothetical protein